jgi:teichuronic acid biosynthesis glycosyltransferase TuaG
LKERFISMEDINNLPLISIITPSYNASLFLPETAESVLSQTYTNWEWLIVDDCSTDGTRIYLEELAKKDQRIKPYFQETNQGAALARNKAIQNAKGKYIAFLDSDDKWVENKLATQIRFMEENDFAFSFTSYRLMEQNGAMTEKVIHAPKKMKYNDLLKNTIIGCLTVMINIEKTGRIQMPNIRSRQDMALWLSVLKRGFVAYGMPEELAYYRKVQGSISSNKVKAAKMNWFVYRKIEKLPVYKAAWCFVNYAWNALKKV